MEQAGSRSQQNAAKQVRRDATEMLASPAARRFLCVILDQCGYANDIPPADSATMAYASGRRRTGLDIVRVLETANPNALQLLMGEAQSMRNKITKHQTKEESTYD